MWFRSRHPSRSALTREQAYEARPIAVEPSNRESLQTGGLRVVIPARPRGYQKWLLRIPDTATRTIELDPAGVDVYDMCDGQTSVHQIAQRFAKKHQIDPHEADMAVVTFIRMMTRKGLVAIIVDK